VPPEIFADGQPPVDGFQIELNEVLAAEGVERLAGCVLRLAVEQSGAVAAALQLTPAGAPARFTWTAANGTARAADVVVPFGACDPVETGFGGIIITRAGDGTCWVRVPTGSGADDGLWLRCGAVPALPPAVIASRLSLLGAVAGIRAESLGTRSAADRERHRYARWYESMDAQIRVLERERQKLAALVNKTEVGAIVLGPDYSIRWANPSIALRFGTGRNPANLMGSYCNRICGAETGPCGDCPVKQVLETRQGIHQERTATVDGVTRYYYVSAFPVRSPQADVEEILVTIQDLTDLETLRRSEARYQMLFERSADAILMADTVSLDVILANPRARTMAGIEGRCNLLDLHPETEREAMEARYRALAAGRPLDNAEIEVTAADGSTLTCNAYGYLFDLDGQQVMLVEFRDVTQVRRLQTELARADHLITLGTMNAGIAHEFKNRLAPLRAFAQMLHLRGSEPERLKAFAPMIVKEVDRLAGLVRDVLDYARPHQPQLEDHDLSELASGIAAELCREFQGSMEQLGVSCAKRFPSEPVPVCLDPEQLRRVFINVLKNALEACEDCPGDRERAIGIDVSREEDAAVIRIRDNGCGIVPSARERIFDPFFTTKGTRGTGLGMCIVKSLVEANRGEIQVHSEVGVGTTVELTFPLRTARRQAA